MNTITRRRSYSEKDLLAEYHVRSLLLVYSGDFVKKLGIFDVIENAAKELQIRFTENGNVVPNPSIELVRELVDQGKKNEVDFVLAVGGGSSIDTAKAVALGIPYDGDVWDFFSKGVSPKEVLNIGVIATTASSGSETSNCAILSSGEWKLGFEDNRIIRDENERNRKDIVSINKRLARSVQKVGLSRYDAFNSSGGGLSFALCMLDENDNGFLLNSVHGTDGINYSYAKEINAGISDTEMSKDEKKALEIALGGRDK